MNNKPDGPAAEGREMDTRRRDRLRVSLEQKLATGSAPVLLPPPIPDHQMLQRIGSGGYGDVWLARSTLGTLRAVKVVYRARFDEDHPYEREFKGIVNYEPISRSHEGLIQVLHVGRNDEAGCFFYVMELADPTEAISTSADAKLNEYSPRTLRSELSRRNRLPPIDAAKLALRLASALAHLHSHGLVHRDIKPSNVIFIGGQPKLADIGLVTGAGSSQSFVGTEGFTPPEGPGTAQGDLYGLGKLLYELATGRDRLDFPQLPLEPGQSPDAESLLELNEVITRACAPDPQQRYSTAMELEAELNLFLAGRSLRRARNLERHLAQLKKFAAAACVLFLLGAGALLFVRNEARKAIAHAHAEAQLRQRAEAAERETQHRLYTALLEQARATVRSGEFGQRVNALDAVVRAAAISNSAALRGVALAAHALPDLRLERELPYGPDFTLRLVDPTFERIAVCRGRGPIEIRSTRNDQLITTLPASTNLPAYNAEWSRDGQFLAVKRDYDGPGIHSDKEVWSVADSQRVLLIHNAPYSSMSFHPRLPRILVGRIRGASVWEWAKPSEPAQTPLPETPIWLEFAPDGERFAAIYLITNRWLVAVHKITGEAVASSVYSRNVPTINWHPSGNWISVADHSGGVYKMDARTGEKHLLGRHKAEATRMAFSPDGAYLISGGWERELICWDARTLRRSFNVALNGYIGHFSADGSKYALETQSNVQLHRFEQASGHREFAEDLGPLLKNAAFSSDNRWLSAAGGERLALWDLQTAGPAALPTNTWATRPSFGTDCELFADRGGACFHWRISPAASERLPPQITPLELTLPDRFASLSVVSNGVVLTTAKGSAFVSGQEMGSEEHAWKPTMRGVNGVSPDGRWLAVFPSYAPYLFLYQLPALKWVTTLTNGSPIRKFQFSPSGQELAVSCRLGVEFWDTKSWQRTRSISNLNNQLYAADGRTMWLSQEFQASGLYDARTLELLLPLPAGTYPLAVSLDGRRLAVSVDLRRLQVWDLAQVREQLRGVSLDWSEN